MTIKELKYKIKKFIAKMSIHYNNFAAFYQKIFILKDMQLVITKKK